LTDEGLPNSSREHSISSRREEVDEKKKDWSSETGEMAVFQCWRCEIGMPVHPAGLLMIVIEY
jgi:hypothetical protein